MSRLTFKEGDNLRDGDMVLEVEGITPVSYPQGVNENGPGPDQKSFYFMHKSDRFQIFYTSK